MSYIESNVRPAVLDKCVGLGHTVFASGEYNLNIVAERILPGRPNEWDDVLHVCYRVNGAWRYHRYPATTDPGRHWIAHASRGAAFLVPGQYRGAWELGLHRGRYRALKQVGPVKVWRDRNRDGSPEKTIAYTGLFGINIHRASGTRLAPTVDEYSAGCIVVRNISDFAEFLGLCEKSAKLYGGRFSATLVETTPRQ